MLECHYPEIRVLHVGCVALSGTLFALRGLLRLADLTIANHIALRATSYVIDSTLLISAIVLTTILHQYSFANGWLTAKLLLLLLYILFGSIALKRARTRVGRLIALMAAPTTFTLIVGVVVIHQPSGWLSLLR